MKRLALLALAAAAPLFVVSSADEAQPAPKAETQIQTPSGAFVDLGLNTRGYREFRRAKDGAVMVLVPEGVFPKWTYTSNPDLQAEVNLQAVGAFLVDKHEVTNAQAAAFLGQAKDLKWSAGSVAKGETRLVASQEWGLEITDKGAKVRAGLEKYPFVGGTGDFAVEYAAWAGAALPHCFEWEKAASGTAGFWFPWGSDKVPDGTLANTYLYGPKHPMPVGSFPAGDSPFGCSDMVGNVAERVCEAQAEVDVKVGALPIMVKGGSWATTHWANNRIVDQDFQSVKDADGTVGFRLVIRDPAVIKALGGPAAPVLRCAEGVDAAFEEAAARNVPVFLFLSYETCGLSDRIRAQVFADPKFIEYCNEWAVVLVGGHPGDGASAPIEPAAGPSVLYPGCKAENVRKVFADLVEVIDVRRFPEAIYNFKVAPGQFVLCPHEEMLDAPEDMIMDGEATMPKDGGDAGKYIAALKAAQAKLGTGQSRTDFAAGKPGPSTTWKPTPKQDK
ncbi:MAG: formylglycine-generating enzyme family protein [Planctomycetes bacterium]|nr:formylglycine-generating enzyme family protein [Planctomycetota bacterium]